MFLVVGKRRVVNCDSSSRHANFGTEIKMDRSAHA